MIDHGTAMWRYDEARAREAAINGRPLTRAALLPAIWSPRTLDRPLIHAVLRRPRAR